MYIMSWSASKDNFNHSHVTSQAQLLSSLPSSDVVSAVRDWWTHYVTFVCLMQPDSVYWECKYSYFQEAWAHIQRKLIGCKRASAIKICDKACFCHCRQLHSVFPLRMKRFFFSFWHTKILQFATQSGAAVALTGTNRAVLGHLRAVLWREFSMSFDFDSGLSEKLGVDALWLPAVELNSAAKVNEMSVGCLFVCLFAWNTSSHTQPHWTQ